MKTYKKHLSDFAIKINEYLKNNIENTRNSNEIRKILRSYFIRIKLYTKLLINIHNLHQI